MCGIAGYVDFSGCRPSGEILKEMAAKLQHRGPDSIGILINGFCGLAHTRLSIIDLPGSSQPMHPQDSPISLVFNGEIYNYREMRQDLKNEGMILGTQGDTEVLLRSIERDWVKSLPKFDGMFAFAAWQERLNQLLLARDPIGKKPLFYTCPRPNLLVFGSEIKALLVHPEVKRIMNIDGLRQVLRFRAVYGEKTLYQNISQLKPGHFLEFDENGLRIKQYYNLYEEIRNAQEEYKNLGENECIVQGNDLLQDAVRKRLIADVPVGAFLSGGLDSSLIVALIKELRGVGGEVQTFSVGFRNDKNSEIPFAEMVSRSIGTRHTEVHLSEEEYCSLFTEMTGYRDAPISEPADLAIAKMSRIAKQSVKVVLSGEGADEIFAGYPKYRFSDVPGWERSILKLFKPGWINILAGVMGIDVRRMLVAIRSITQRQEIDRLSQWFSYLDCHRLAALFPGLDWSNELWQATMQTQKDALQTASSLSPLGRMQFVDCLGWLPGNMLERGDRMTMSAGLEMRVPFLDKKLVSFGLALNDHMKIRGHTFKWIVRQWASSKLPQAITFRKKWGFRVPLADWFRGEMRSMLYEYLLSSRGLIKLFGSQKQIEKLLKLHDKKTLDASLELWTLLSTEIWFQDIFLSH